MVVRSVAANRVTISLDKGLTVEFPCLDYTFIDIDVKGLIAKAKILSSLTGSEKFFLDNFFHPGLNSTHLFFAPFHFLFALSILIGMFSASFGTVRSLSSPGNEVFSAPLTDFFNLNVTAHTGFI